MPLASNKALHKSMSLFKYVSDIDFNPCHTILLPSTRVSQNSDLNTESSLLVIALPT